MKRVMMMRPKLVLKESMSVNQYIPPCDGKTQNKEYMYMTRKTVMLLKESLMDNMNIDKLVNYDIKHYRYITKLWTSVHILNPIIGQFVALTSVMSSRAQEIEGETEQRQEQCLVLQIGSELRKLIHHSCTDPLHVTKLQDRERELHNRKN